MSVKEVARSFGREKRLCNSGGCLGGRSGHEPGAR